MAINNILIIFLTFFWLRLIAKSKNETSTVEIPRESTTQQNTTGVPFITNLRDTTQNGPLFDQEIWCCKSGTTYLPG